jgi:hypothetical protein
MYALHIAYIMGLQVQAAEGVEQGCDGVVIAVGVAGIVHMVQVLQQRLGSFWEAVPRGIPHCCYRLRKGLHIIQLDLIRNIKRVPPVGTVTAAVA